MISCAWALPSGPLPILVPQSSPGQCLLMAEGGESGHAQWTSGLGWGARGPQEVQECEQPPALAWLTPPFCQSPPICFSVTSVTSTFPSWSLSLDQVALSESPAESQLCQGPMSLPDCNGDSSAPQRGLLRALDEEVWRDPSGSALPVCGLQAALRSRSPLLPPGSVVRH